jgi:8-oxo-dGTP pyrophosphatase MutT (NUDIX family)
MTSIKIVGKYSYTFPSPVSLRLRERQRIEALGGRAEPLVSAAVAETLLAAIGRAAMRTPDLAPFVSSISVSFSTGAEVVIVVQEGWTESALAVLGDAVSSALYRELKLDPEIERAMRAENDLGERLWSGAWPQSVEDRDSNAIQIVSAAIVRAGGAGEAARILLAQRSLETSFPMSWCTAGGKIEPGEQPFAALRRELREEMGVNLVPVVEQREAYVVVVSPPHVRRRLCVTCYLIDSRSVIETPRPGDKTAGLGWFTAHDLDYLVLAPADTAGLDGLKRALFEALER